MKDNIASITFCICYLLVIWAVMIKAYADGRKKGPIKERPACWKWVFIAYFLLAFGDIFHLAPRVYIYAKGLLPMDIVTRNLLGPGYIISSITMTYLYIALTHAWIDIFGEKYSTRKQNRNLLIIMYVTFVIRIILVFHPYNSWVDRNPTGALGFDFHIISSIPLYVIGILLIVKIFQSTVKEKASPTGIDEQINDGFYKAAIWFIVSFATYTMTIGFKAFDSRFGLFMIPKTIAYLIALYYHYKTILRRV
ncbi:hypothetical protein ACFL20_09480 [Spirochaetota bacterium]